MKKLLLVILIVTSNYAQDLESIFAKKPLGYEATDSQINQDINLTDLKSLPYTPVEGSIDPDTYILGPGDLLGVNIISTKSVTLPVRVNPVGEIMIPSVGVINVNGISLTEAKTKIKEHVNTYAIKNALVNTTLMDIRRFKIQVLGAIHNPGYINVTSVDRVYDALLLAGGVQKFAHPNIIQLQRNNEIIDIDLQDFLSNRDIAKNIKLMDGDVLFVPYSSYAMQQGFNTGLYNANPVTIYGFISQSSTSNVIKYFPGYTAREYIAIAGGTKGNTSGFSIGNSRKTIIHRADGTKIKNALNEVVQPGDLIEIPPSFSYKLIGGDGIIRTLGAVISSAYLIYRYTEDKK